MPPLPEEDIPEVTWEEFQQRFFWEQGEHITFLGPTGSGKTTLAIKLLHLRSYVCALGTKPRDATLDQLIRREKYKKIRAWPPPPSGGRSSLRTVLWPEFRRPEDMANQQYQLDRALREMFTAGGWCIFADELYYLCHLLGLTRLLETIWTQGRSLGISLVGGTQRPAHVPLFAYSQATHLFAFRFSDERDVARVGGLGGMSSKVIQKTITTLRPHEVLYVNTRDGELMRFFTEKG